MCPSYLDTGSDLGPIHFTSLPYFLTLKNGDNNFKGISGSLRGFIHT